MRPTQRPKTTAAFAGVAIAVIGMIVYASTAATQADTLDVAWEERRHVAAGDAYRGPWRMNRSEFHYVDDPTVAVAEDGSAVVAWVEQSRRDIFLRVYGPDGAPRFERPVAVSEDPGVFSWLPRIVLGGSDAREIFVLWQEIVFSGGSHGGEIFFARSTDGGRTFSDAVNLSNTIHGAGKGRLTDERWDNGSLDLARGPDGTLYAAWTEYQGPLKVARSTDGGRTFSSPERVAGGPGEPPARGPSLAVHDDTVYLAWTVGGSDEADIHLARSTDRGRSFGRPRVVERTEGHSDAPKIAVDSRGAVHLVWAESPAGRFGRYHVRYRRSDDAGRSFDHAETVAVPRGEPYESMSFPDLDLDGDDHVYVLVELYPSWRGRPRALALSLSADRGRTFSTPELLPGTRARRLGFNGSQQGLLMNKLDVNEDGAVAVVNSTFEEGEASHVWLFRGRASQDARVSVARGSRRSP